MKKSMSILMVLFLAVSSESFGQWSFGISPGVSMNSAWLGYTVKEKFVPFIGCKVISLKADFSTKGVEYDEFLDEMVPFESSVDVSLSAIVPTIGLKYFFKEKERVKTYGILSVNKPMLNGKVKLDGDTQDEFEEAIKKTKLFGMSLGFGGEYFFDKQFSVGAEFGIRMYSVKYEDSLENQIATPNGLQTETMTNTFTLGFNPTYAKFTVNFYL